MKRKSHELPNSTQSAIGRAYVEGKKAGRDVTYQSLAHKYHCTSDQVRAYARKYKSGAYKGISSKRRPNAPPAIGATLEEEIQKAIEEIAVSDLDPMERIAALDRLANARKTAQQIALQGHLRATDATLICAIVRRYEPEASDEDIIAIIREERDNVIIDR